MDLAVQQRVSDALIRSGQNDFTEEDAQTILNWEFGSRPIQIGDRRAYPEGVVKAIQKLGGIYQSGWGVTSRPKYQPVELV